MECRATAYNSWQLSYRLLLSSTTDEDIPNRTSDLSHEIYVMQT